MIRVPVVCCADSHFTAASTYFLRVFYQHIHVAGHGTYSVLVLHEAEMNPKYL